ncbi:nucleotidyl transferase AbiEii/AbiGii toxin family protein [Arthrobacter sp. 31Y]|uniref:nucleotidyl transferase AbiEii/AbiGii toxin family protein n=1 Tax=Arthrobacter sp. 31Y TaxID=1115632 RepID=UPI000465E0C6|nr:nucleotidyl transferase AbiEii/AbiGii toxin family protein [Arthrobacter sp. 31Y]
MDDAQRVATEIALTVLAADGFILAGGQALAEHGVIHRMSDDIDLFAQYRSHTPETFAASVDKITDALTVAGYSVQVTRQYEEFASLTVTKAETAVVIDLGLDWWENKPAIVDVGPVLSLKDSVASKLLTVYSRGYARDYLDAYSILSSKRFTPRRLIELCQRRDPHLDLEMLASAMTGHRALAPTEFTKYGLPEADLQKLDRTLTGFATTIRQHASRTGSPAEPVDLTGLGIPGTGPELA